MNSIFEKREVLLTDLNNPERLSQLILGWKKNKVLPTYLNNYKLVSLDLKRGVLPID